MIILTGRRTPAAGIATCRLRGDVAALQAALELPQAQMSTPHAGLFPEFEHLEVGPTPSASHSHAPEAFSHRSHAPEQCAWCLSTRQPVQCLLLHGIVQIGHTVSHGPKTSAPAAAAQVFAGQMPEANFPEVLARFSEEARLDGTYFLCKQDDMATLARALEKVRGRQRRC